MKGFASNIKEALPDNDQDMIEFKKQIQDAKDKGLTGMIECRASSGSVLHYSLDFDSPIMYHPYIKYIFTCTSTKNKKGDDE